jgi:hypothetical protein
MQADDASQQKFKDVATRGFGDRMALTERGLVAGGVLLAKMGDEGLCINGEKERILTLLSIAHRCAVPPAVFGFLRRASKHWRSGDKTLACMQLSQSGLGKLDEEGAYRLSLAAELIEAGFTPRELARELGLSPVQFDISKYDENQPRVPAGNGRESGRWTSADGTPAVAPESTLTEGRSAEANAGDIHREHGLPRDAVAVTRPDGTKIDDPKSPTKKLRWTERGWDDAHKGDSKTK